MVAEARLTLRPADIDRGDIPAMDDLPEWAASALGFIRQAVDSGETVTMTAEEETFSPAEMAQEIGISRAGVQRRIASGEITCRKVGSRYRIPRREVERFRAVFIRDLTATLADDF